MKLSCEVDTVQYNDIHESFIGIGNGLSTRAGYTEKQQDIQEE